MNFKNSLITRKKSFSSAGTARTKVKAFFKTLTGLFTTFPKWFAKTTIN